jgi:hypothetical protein
MKDKLLTIIGFCLIMALMAGTDWRTSSQREIDTHAQDATNTPFQYYLMREDKIDITLIETAQVDSNYVVVSSGHGFTAGGEYIAIFEGDFEIQTKVKAVSNDTITLSRNINIPFSVNSVVIRGSVDMNVDGSATPQEFVLDRHTGTNKLDIVSIHITIWNDNLQGDESTFGDLSELANGLYVSMEGPFDFSFGDVYCSNSDFRSIGADISYSSRGPAGTYAITMDYDIHKNYKVVLRMDPKINRFKAVVQDDIDALDRFRISMKGHTTEGE